jgi:hypothetical protein
MSTILEAPMSETASSSYSSVSASPPVSPISPGGLSTSPARRSGNATRAEPKPDLSLLRHVLGSIDMLPQCWRQTTFYAQDPLVGTVACVGGFAMLLRGYRVEKLHNLWAFFRPSGERVPLLGDEAASLLGLTRKEQEALFHPNASRADVQRVAERIAARAGEQL